MNDHDELTHRAYKKHGDSFLQEMNALYGDWILDRVANALNELKSKMTMLDTTDDFVTIITLGDESYESEYRVLRKTLTYQQVNEIFHNFKG